jgi:hypothetical protein
MDREEQEWMAYIDGEVRALCEAKGWGQQIRRKWTVRERPVEESPIDDYEWKLIPSAQGRLADTPPGDYEGTYYVLRFEKCNGGFVLQHDTSHCGRMGLHWEVATYTEIRPFPMMLRPLARVPPVGRSEPSELPPSGWLRDHLQRLVTLFRPNVFSVT